MSGIEKISKAILDKVKTEAQDIIKDAESKAAERVGQAKKEQKGKLEEEKNKLIEQAKSEAARILAQASIKARQELLTAKTAVIDEIISKAKRGLASPSSGATLSLNLLKETLNIMDSDKARVYVSPRDVAATQKLIKGDKQLAGKITETKEFDCTGGVIVEDLEGKIRIDNTYETRLEMLLPRLLPEISKELFAM